jgi:predicted permease
MRGFALGGEAGSEPILTEEVTGNYFAVTGIRPVLGRAFLPQETEIGSVSQVTVISHHLWLRRFGGAPGVLGQSIRLNEKSFTIVGVAPEGIVSRMAPVKPDAWVPLGIPGSSSERRVEALEERNERHFLILGRMREGVSMGQVQAQLAVLSGNLHGEYAHLWEDDAGRPRALTAVREEDSRINPRARRLLAGITGFFLGAAGLILLIACSNVTTLFLARAGRRRQEMAIRVSIGASRRRIMSLLLTEGLIPGLLGGVVGVLLAWYAAGAMESLSLPLNIPLNIDISIDYRVLSFALAISVGASLLFGLVPALDASKPDLVSSLKGDARGMRRLSRGLGIRRLGLRNLMVVVQCAASLVLVVGAALFLRTLQGATTMDLGLEPERVAVMSKSLSRDEYSPEAGLQYYRDLRSRLTGLPGVVDAQLSRCLELTFFQLQCATEVEVVGGESASVEALGEEAPDFARNSVTPGYLEMLGIPLLRGRTLQESDGPDAPRVAVVNETFAQRLWPGEDPLGRTFTMSVPEDQEVEGGSARRSLLVVGMTRDGKYEDFDDESVPYFWTSLYQEYTPMVAVSLKGAVSAEAMVPLLRQHVELDDGEVPFLEPATLESQISLQFIHLRIASAVLGWGGAFGLILAAIGIYGVVSVAVTERTREMAIRVAMGAERLQVIRRVAGGGLMLALVGLVAGLVVVLPLAHLLRSVFYGVGAVDPLALGVGIGVLVLSALVASVVPARRVTRIEPMRILREE